MPFPDPLHRVATRQWEQVEQPEEAVLLTAAADVRANGSFRRAVARRHRSARGGTAECRVG